MLTHENTGSLKENQVQRQKNSLLMFRYLNRMAANLRKSYRIPKKSKKRKASDGEDNRGKKKQAIPSRPMLRKNEINHMVDATKQRVTLLPQKLALLATQKPEFLETFWASKPVGFLTAKEKHLTGNELKSALVKLNKKTHFFFQASNKEFLDQLVCDDKYKKKPSTTKWSQPNILRSFETPEWRVLLNVKDGQSFYPLNFDKNLNNIFDLETLDETFLFNPPYTDYFSPLSREHKQPLRNHVHHLFELAIRSQKPQIVMFPCYDEMPQWFLQLTTNPLVTPLFFYNKIAFARGKLLELRRLADYKIVLLIFGVYSPANIWVRNNAFGNFQLTAKLLTTLKNVFADLDLRNHSDFLTTFLSKSLTYQKECHQTWKQDSICYEELPTTQLFTQFQMPTTQCNQNQYLFFQQSHQHVFYTKRMLKIPNSSKKQVLRPVEPLPLHQTPTSQHQFCEWCGQGSHSSQLCMINPKNNVFVPDERDMPTLNFIKKQTPLCLEHPGSKAPTSKQLSHYLKKIVDFSNKLKTKAPKVEYHEGLHFSTLRNFWHTSLALGNPSHLAAIFFSGFNLMTHLGTFEYPNVEIETKPTSPETTNKIWQHVVKLLQENKIWPCQREKIHTIAPIFLLEDYNSVGVWKERLIHDFSWFKNFYPSYRYRLPTPLEVKAKLSGYICITIDIKSAFPHASFLFSNLVGFGCFHPVTGRTHYFASLAPLFGMQASPFICFVFLRFLGSFFDKLNFPTLCYVDDFKIGIAKISEGLSAEEIKKRTEFVRTIFTIAGFRISPKLKLIPTDFNQYIGKFFSTSSDIVLPNIIKLPFLYTQLVDAIQSKKASVRLLDSLRGKLAYHASHSLNVFTKKFDKIISSLRKKYAHPTRTEKEVLKKVYAQAVPVDNNVLHLILNFVQRISSIYTDIEGDTYIHGWDALITVDASIHLGGSALVWPNGAFLPNTFSLHPELSHTGEHSSTLRELVATKKALILSCPFLEERQVKKVVILNDNKINVQHLHQLAPRGVELQKAYHDFQRLLQTLPFSVEFKWVPREDLAARVADKQSKLAKPIFHFNVSSWAKQLTQWPGTWNVFSNPKKIACFTAKHIYKLQHLTVTDNIVIVLPPYIEHSTFRSILEVFYLLKIRFLILMCAYRTPTFLAISEKIFPNSISAQHGPLPIRFPYERKTSGFISVRGHRD